MKNVHYRILGDPLELLLRVQQVFAWYSLKEIPVLDEVILQYRLVLADVVVQRVEQLQQTLPRPVLGPLGRLVVLLDHPKQFVPDVRGRHSEHGVEYRSHERLVKHQSDQVHLHLGLRHAGFEIPFGCRERELPLEILDEIVISTFRHVALRHNVAPEIFHLVDVAFARPTFPRPVRPLLAADGPFQPDGGDDLVLLYLAVLERVRYHNFVAVEHASLPLHVLHRLPIEAQQLPEPVHEQFNKMSHELGAAHVEQIVVVPLHRELDPAVFAVQKLHVLLGRVVDLPLARVRHLLETVLREFPFRYPRFLYLLVTGGRLRHPRARVATALAVYRVIVGPVSGAVAARMMILTRQTRLEFRLLRVLLLAAAHRLRPALAPSLLQRSSAGSVVILDTDGAGQVLDQVGQRPRVFAFQHVVLRLVRDGRMDGRVGPGLRSVDTAIAVHFVVVLEYGRQVYVFLLGRFPLQEEVVQYSKLHVTCDSAKREAVM